MSAPVSDNSPAQLERRQESTTGPETGAAAPQGDAAEPPREAPAAPPSSLMHLVRGILQDLPGLVSDRVTLLALELKRARQSLVQMVALAFAAAILLATAWITLWIGLAFALFALDMPGWAIFFLILLLNVGGAWLAVKRAGHLASFLTLPATLRRLTVAPSRAAPPVPAGTVPGVVAPASPPDISSSEPKAKRDENAAVH